MQSSTLKTQAESESPALACSYHYCETPGRLDWRFLTGQMERNGGSTKGVKEIMTGYTHHKKGGAPHAEFGKFLEPQ